MFECHIKRGDPPATIEWTKEGRAISNGDRYSISSKDDTAVLVISDTILKDAGTYMCQASNKLGKATTQCMLTVNMPPEITYEEALKQPITTKAGKTLSLPV